MSGSGGAKWGQPPPGSNLALRRPRAPAPGEGLFWLEAVAGWLDAAGKNSKITTTSNFRHPTSLSMSGKTVA